MIFRNKIDWIKARLHAPIKVLDVGFIGQGLDWRSDTSLHSILKPECKELYGIDIILSDKNGLDPHRYKEASAEDFSFDTKFDAIVAGDLIEHLSNPGLFLSCVKRHLEKGARLYLTTPNAFNLFNLAEKITKDEPTINSDHTFYFNSKALKKLLEKNGFEVVALDYILSLNLSHRESLKKRILNIFYCCLAKRTMKFVETLACEARVKEPDTAILNS